MPHRLGPAAGKRRVVVLTGSRSEYGLLRPVMTAIRRHPGLRLGLVAAGMHLASEFGRTLDHIARDGFRVDATVEMDPGGLNNRSMAAAVGRGISSLTGAFARTRPDVVVVLGDRIEALAGAVAAAYSGIPVAHIHGGDVTQGGLDESARHAITKFSHIHFAATPTSAGRVLRLGEDPRRVFVVGAPGLDSILHSQAMDDAVLARCLGHAIPSSFLVLVQHPVTSQSRHAGAQMRETAAAIRALGMDTVAVYPNSDAGGRAMIGELARLRRLRFVHLHRSLSHAAYLGLLRRARLLVGNSSSGIIESPSFRLPTVNIGIRQEGRERGANVIDAPHDRFKILSCMKRALSPRFRQSLMRLRSPYGDGRAGERIARTLSSVRLDGILQKRLTY